MSFIGGLAGAGAQIYGADKQYQASEDAQKMQYNMFNQIRGDLQPFMSGGSGAFNMLQNLMGMGGPGASANMLAGLRNYPGYQFALQQGQQGLDRSLAARGLGVSGGEMKDAMNYNQGQADQLFNTYYNQLMGMSQLGENAAAGSGTFGMQAATNAGEAGMWGAQQMANGMNGAANTLFGQNGTVSNLNWGDAFSWLSDRRAKDNVVEIGKLASKLPVYSFTYKGSDEPQVGVMADEVEKVVPIAVKRAPDGLKRVNYDLVSRLPGRGLSVLPAFKEAA